jgi:hypothetical protein
MTKPGEIWGSLENPGNYRLLIRLTKLFVD